MLIDCFGNPSYSEYYMRKNFAKSACQVDTATSGTTYISFFNTNESQPIHKITESAGVITVLWGYGTWENRAAVTYDADLNTAKEV